MFQLQLLDVKPRLEYLQPRATLISSVADYPKKEIHAQCRSIQQQQGIDDVHSHSGSIMPSSKPIIHQEDTLKKMKIVNTKECIKKQYPELFKSIGRFPGKPYHIHADLSITPKQTPCRPIPVHLKQTFRQEIDKLLTAGVIKPIHEGTPWINSFVLVETNDKGTGKPKLLICLDLTNLNKTIIHETYCFHTPVDIAHKLSGATVITVLNCSKGYWHQPLDEESSFLTTFNSDIGQFRFTVMSFRGTVVGDVFQRKLDSIFLNLDNVMTIADDIMVIAYQENK